MSSVVRRRLPKKSSFPFKQPAIRRNLIQAALRSVDPVRLVRRYVGLKRDVLSIGRTGYDLKKGRAVYVIGAGKASAAMAASLEKILGDKITAGLVVVPYGYLA